MGLLDNAYKNRMEELVTILNRATESYYNGNEVMTNFEYDKLFDELKELEKSSGIILPNSPTQKVGSPISSKVDKIEKVTHEFPAKSLDKTKDVSYICEQFRLSEDMYDEAVVMWKLDGSTVQLTYDNGKLTTAATRGDGYIGQDITHNAVMIEGIPINLSYKGHMVVRGEAIMTYEDFENINAKLPEDSKFKNPRNLAASTITMLDPNEVKNRHIKFKAFELVSYEPTTTIPSNMTFEAKLDMLETKGFGVVEHRVGVTYKPTTFHNKTLGDIIHEMTEEAKDIVYPVDGLVIALNDCEYANRDEFKDTEHHPHMYKGYALKWEDEVARTILKDIEWSTSRTGTLTPVAIFEPVDLEGSTVQRASLHNASILEDLKLNKGDEIGVIKANKIIPQVVANYSKTESDYTVNIPQCPSCHSQAEIVESEDSGVKVMVCPNENCPAREVDRFSHFVSREAMNIEGLSDATLEKFLGLGFIKEFHDLYEIDMYCDKIRSLEGFGDKSYDNLYDAIERSKDTTFERVVVGLGIPSIGVKQAKMLANYFEYDMYRFLNNNKDLSSIDGIGEVISNNINSWLGNSTNQYRARQLLSYLNIEVPDTTQGSSLEGKTFVITGTLNHYENRKQLEKLIEDNGGKTSGSVSSKTSYLINNDVNSTSSKNKKANELGIPIISEEEFNAMLV